MPICTRAGARPGHQRRRGGGGGAGGKAPLEDPKSLRAGAIQLENDLQVVLKNASLRSYPEVCAVVFQSALRVASNHVKNSAVPPPPRYSWSKSVKTFTLYVGMYYLHTPPRAYGTV